MADKLPVGTRVVMKPGHPWETEAGTIERNEPEETLAGRFPYVVRLDRGMSCMAKRKHITVIQRPEGD